MKVNTGLSVDLLEKYEFFDYGHALEIISNTYPQEWDDLKECLRLFEMTIRMILSLPAETKAQYQRSSIPFYSQKGGKKSK